MKRVMPMTSTILNELLFDNPVRRFCSIYNERFRIDDSLQQEAFLGSIEERSSFRNVAIIRPFSGPTPARLSVKGALSKPGSCTPLRNAY